MRPDRVIPPDQRLEAGNFLFGGSNDRLVFDGEFAPLDRLAEVIFKDLTFRRFAVHRGLIDAVLAASGALCCIKRKVGIADESVGAGAIGVTNDDADRSANCHVVALDRIGSRDLFDQRSAQRFDEADVHGPGKDRLELIAAQPSNLPVVAHDRGESLGNLPEQRVADRVAERVVDVLEPIEIDHEKRKALAAVGGIAKRFVQRLSHHRPVRQTGQRIEARKTGNLAVRLALLGQVGPDAAKSEEAAAIVENRIARQ